MAWVNSEVQVNKEEDIMKGKVIWYKEILATLRSKEMSALENGTPLNAKLKKQLKKLNMWYIVDLNRENKKKINFIRGK